MKQVFDFNLISVLKTDTIIVMNLANSKKQKMPHLLLNNKFGKIIINRFTIVLTYFLVRTNQFCYQQ